MPISTSAAQPNNDVCDICQKKFKNRLGVIIHKAKVHKNSTATITATNNTTHTLDNIHTANVMTTTQAPTITATNNTYHNTLDNIRTANYTSTTQAAASTTNTAQATIGLCNKRPVRAVVKDKQEVRWPMGEEFKCTCGRVCKNFVGLQSHRRSCTVVKRLLVGQSTRSMLPSVSTQPVLPASPVIVASPPLASAPPSRCVNRTSCRPQYIS